MTEYTRGQAKVVWRSPHGAERCSFCGGEIGQGHIVTDYQDWRTILRGIACTPCASTHQEMSLEELERFSRNHEAA